MVVEEELFCPTEVAGAAYIENGVYCGDGPSAMDRFVAAGTDIRCVFTDPPFGVLTKKDIAKPHTRWGVLKRSADWDDMTEDEALELFVRMFKSAAKLKNAWVHTFVSDRLLSPAIREGEAAGLNFHMDFVWHKTNPPPRIRRKMPRKSTELGLIFSVGKPDFYADIHNHFECPFVSPHHRVHFAQKPEPLILEYLNAYTLPGEVVFDPFCGSGSTILAAKRLKRVGIGVELDPIQAEKSARYVGCGSTNEYDLESGKRLKRPISSQKHQKSVENSVISAQNVSFDAVEEEIL